MNVDDGVVWDLSLGPQCFNVLAECLGLPPSAFDQMEFKGRFGNMATQAQRL